jgi:hypothetical protein
VSVLRTSHHLPVRVAFVVATAAILLLAVPRWVARPVADPAAPPTASAPPPSFAPAAVDASCAGLLAALAGALADPAVPAPADLTPDARVALDRWRVSLPSPGDQSSATVPGPPAGDGARARVLDAELAARCAVPP